ncbi:LysR family transcriptional regulator [Paracoccus onubensis]|uniref:LysR family transcriptional regulator n=1 Tax=Paracoccus onubensis TaxID=1675788 RepID=UPI00272FF535|nr:LysR family transcriptional regulator [Paracoccus onubensis]MDP0926137.1 LysR family transcriptional regulator [Paracoccus onubensis]
MRIDRRNDLDLRLVESFVAVMERGTTPAAAEYLGLSQSAVWNAIRSFEAQLDVTLFQRQGRRLEPTDEGRLIYDDLRPLIGVLEDLSKRLHALKHRKRGRIRIFASPPMGHAVLPPALLRAVAGCEGLDVEVTVQEPERVRHSVELGLADLGLAMGQLENPGVQTRRLGEAELVAILPRDHLLTMRAVLGPSDLAKYPVIGIGPVLSTLVVGAFAQQGVRYEPRLETAQAQTACAMVNAGLGVAVVDPYTAALSAGLGIVTRKFAPVTRVAAIAMLPECAEPNEMMSLLLENLAATVAEMEPVGWG